MYWLNFKCSFYEGVALYEKALDAAAYEMDTDDSQNDPNGSILKVINHESAVEANGSSCSPVRWHNVIQKENLSVEVV